ncbi:hypothetical protein ACNY67_06840 [Pantoea sp. KXB45]|uniref:hypothetical protein n=1 Tax=Pantoea sp. KXB45 TaxID=3402309 RepID=UPI003AB149F3
MLGIISALCSLIGSILLAYRVYKILGTFKTTLSLHEHNINHLIYKSNNPDYMTFTFTGSHEASEEFMQKTGIKLVVSGFALLGIGALLKVIELTIALAQPLLK